MNIKRSHTDPSVPEDDDPSAPHSKLIRYGEGYIMSDENLFPDAVELLGSLGELEDYLGQESVKNPEELARKIMQRIESYCSKADDSTHELVENTLSDFGEFLLMRGIQGAAETANVHAFTLLKHLYHANNKQQFLQSVLEIKQFCTATL